MERIIITEEAAYFRACARQTLAGKWTKPVLAVLIVDVFMQIPTMFLDSFFSVRVRSLNVMLKNAGMYEDIMAFSPAGAILEIFIAGAFAFGLTAFFIAFFRRQDAGTTLVFSGFGRFINTLVLFLLYMFIVVAGMILFIVPGVIFFYRYSQAFCIMCDDPKKSPIQYIAKNTLRLDRKSVV